jgi:tetratricopeptide (TPR) repeat protein
MSTRRIIMTSWANGGDLWKNDPYYKTSNKRMKYKLIFCILVLFFCAYSVFAADESIIKVYPENYAKNSLNEGKSYAEKGMYQEAVKEFDKVIDFDSKNAEVYNLRGYTNSMLYEYDAALGDFTRALENDPNYADSYYNRAIIYAMYLNSWDDAINDFTRAIQLKPDFADAYLGRGTVLFKKGDFVSAISDYSKAIDTKPDDSEFYYNRALAWYSAGDCTKAIEDVDKAQALGCEIDLSFIKKLELAAGRQIKQ